MLQEIAEQPAALERTIAQERAKIAKLGNLLKSRDIDLIVLVARGSSDNAALFGRYLLEITTGIPVSLSAPSVHTVYNARLRLDHALVVGVSQSGEGEDINRVLESARDSGAYTIGITNEPGSSMTSVVHETLLTHGGRERSVAATKTYTGQLLHFYMLAEALADGSTGLGFEAIPDFAAQALSLRPQIEQMVERYVFMENCVVVGRGLVYANAFEMALKLMETCYVVAERFSSADFLHGPLAVVERHFPIFAFAPPGVTLGGVRELLARRVPSGVYHCVSSGHCTWLEFALAAAEILGVEPRVQPVRVADVTLRAERPKYCALSNAKLAAAGIEMPTWKAALKDYLSTFVDDLRNQPAHG